MLLDEVTIEAKAGKGGRGAVAFNKLKMAQGPTGGNGGRGGSILFEGVSDLGALAQFRYQKDLIAPDGGNGQGNFVDGKDGKDLIFKIPVGTVIHNLTNGQKTEIIAIGQKIIVAKGGNGGKGNYKFRSSIDTTPKRFQPGLPGEEFLLQLELKLIADIGLIGLPNAGKSTLLNNLTKAKTKVANYPFTTLEPNLGVYYDLIIADIPGLIEGASEGKGLGHKFLRHIERTQTLFHLISAETENLTKDYRIIRQELIKHNPLLGDKDEYLIISQSDTVDHNKIEKLKKEGIKLNPHIGVISILDETSLVELKKILNHISSKKTQSKIEAK